MRGTLRMPAGGDAVGVLKQLAPLLNTWGGHRLAAGFSVKMENWQTVREKMEEILSGVKVVGEKEELLFWNPANLDMKTWTEASALGPFGMDNPAPMLYAPYNGKMSLSPLGKGGKHVKGLPRPRLAAGVRSRGHVQRRLRVARRLGLQAAARHVAQRHVASVRS